MSRFNLIEIEKESTKGFPDYGTLDLNRETEFRVYEKSQDQYGNISSSLLMSTPNIIYAKLFLRSCRLIDGVEVEL